MIFGQAAHVIVAEAILIEGRSMLKAGDIYVRKVSDGRYAAVRVLRVEEKKSLVAMTCYLGTVPPDMDEPLLRETVVQRRFLLDGRPARMWLGGRPPKIFTWLGNLPPSTEEAGMECNVFSFWSEHSGNEAYLEWRWIHDRPAFEQEVRARTELMVRRLQKPSKPKKMMAEEIFWSIIDRLAWDHTGDDSKVLAPAIEELMAMPKAAIEQFEERLAFLLYQLDTKAHASNMGKYSYDAKANYVSADGFLYARCVVVANGRTFYELVLSHPEEMPKDMEFEALLGLAPKAWEMKTGNEFEYSTGCSYETFRNRNGWE